MEQVSGAMTNLVFICRSPAAAPPHAAVIVRVFGQGGQLFSQRDERNIFLLASDLGLGPKCLVGGLGWAGMGGRAAGWRLGAQACLHAWRCQWCLCARSA